MADHVLRFADGQLADSRPNPKRRRPGDMTW